ncbi:MAG TPA: hypothetical protein VK151_16720 [Fluviicola sp.]|nr:hypothetical protein [Fluviicola sp.]
MANRLVGIGLIALVFLGSIGIPLYRHSCSHEQITIQTLFTMSDHCEAEAETEDSCCEKAIPEQSESVDDNCCTDEIKRLSLPFDYFESAHYELPVWIAVIPKLSELRFVPESIPSDESLIACQITEPPPKPLGERLPVNCCWRL